MKTNWLEVKETYITGNLSYPELAKEFGLSESTIKKRAMNEKWTDQRNEYRTKLERKIEEKRATLDAKDYIERMKKADEVEKIMLNKVLTYAKELDINKPSDIVYFHKAQKTIESIVQTTDKIYNKDNQEQDNNITVVLDDSLKEYFN